MGRSEKIMVSLAIGLPFAFVPLIQAFRNSDALGFALLNLSTTAALLLVVLRYLLKEDESAIGKLYERFDPSKKLRSQKEVLWKYRQLTEVLIELFSPVCSAEVALFDKSSGVYRSALLIGVPREGEGVAMSAGAVDWERTVESLAPSIIFIPIKFSGEVRGTLRFCMRDPSQLPTAVDHKLAHHAGHLSSTVFSNALHQGELTALSQQTQQTLKAKTGFLANISHEIRAPLALVSNTLQILRDNLLGELNDEQTAIIVDSQKGLSHLLALVSDVLKFSKVESGTEVADPQMILLSEALDTVVVILSGELAAKQQSVSIDCKEQLSVWIDPKHLQQILTNLLSNASKYTMEKGTIRLQAHEDLGGSVVVSITDSGVGISKEMLSSIFEPFERGDSAYALGQTGYGIGLALVKKLVSLNQGTIEVRSEVGKGSKFSVALPSQGDLVTTSDTVGKKIAISQDQTLIDHLIPVNAICLSDALRTEHELLLQTLRASHFDVAEAQSLDEITRGFSTGVYLIDASENERSLLIALQFLSSLAVNAKIVVLTPRAFGFEIEKILKAGATRVITKPYTLDEVVDALRRLSN